MTPRPSRRESANNSGRLIYWTARPPLPLLLSLLLLVQLVHLRLVQAAELQDASAGSQPAPAAPQPATKRVDSRQSAVEDEYLIGLGIADITGPSADINLVSVLGQLAETVASLFGSGPARTPPATIAASRSLFATSSRQFASRVAIAAAASPLLQLLACDRRKSPKKNNNELLSSKFLRQLCGASLTTGAYLGCRPSSRRKFAETSAAARQATISIDERPIMNLAYPSWRDLQNVKLQVKMGYAKPTQDAGGIHLRQFSRAALIEDKLGSRLLYVNLDNGMVSQLLRTRVLRRLATDFGAHIFNETNVMLTATHTHSCPGGYFQYMLYNIPSAGFISQTLEALVEGIARSVQRAYANLQPGRIYLARGELLDASVNRSPTAYLNNPAEERAQFAHDTDKDMWLLRLVDRAGQPLGMLNWFAVHGTSMNNSNHLISSDNKGYAALLMEEEFNGRSTLPGQGKFVAMFAQANEGDVSPNTRGSRCIDSGLPCDSATSTCGTPPRNEKCIASGPGRDMFESTQMIGYKQYYKARALFLDTTTQRPVSGPLRFVHEHIDITKQQVPLYESLVELHKRHHQDRIDAATLQAQHQLLQPQSSSRLRRRQDKRTVEGHVLLSAMAKPVPSVAIELNATYQTCNAGLGYSFAAGTTDGPGAFDFQQGDTASTRYWNMVRDFLRRPSEEQIRCHHPKPILLSTGEMDFPYMWHPKVVPTQIFMIGQVALVALPGEFTTMAGRRVRNAVKRALQEHQLPFTTYPSAYNENDDHGDEDEEDQDDNDDHHADERQPNGTDNDGTDLLTSNGARALRQPTNRTLISNSKRVRRRLSRPAAPIELEVILSGLSNVYTSYITTVEEYEVQRYEGASTLYGPHTLQAYMNQFKRLAGLLTPKRTGLVPLDDSLQPPDLTKSLFTLKAGVIYDGAPHNKAFGDLLQDVETLRAYRCREQVSAAFVAGNPRNDLRQEQSFLYVDKFEPTSATWRPVANDASWETKFIWERTNTLFGESKATIIWNIPDQCQSGVYRLRHYGAHKSLLQTVSQYAGKSSPFKVLNQHDNEQASEQQLEQTLRLARQADEMQALPIQTGLFTAASQPKNDSPDTKGSAASVSLFASPFKYLSSLARWRW